MDHNVTTSAYCMTQNCIYFYAIQISCFWYMVGYFRERFSGLGRLTIVSDFDFKQGTKYYAHNAHWKYVHMTQE